jgi:hypothetical protein
MLVWICVAIRILSNPISNALQKVLTRRDVDALSIVCATHLLLSVSCLPVLISQSSPRDLAFWWNMGVSAGQRLNRHGSSEIRSFRPGAN